MAQNSTPPAMLIKHVKFILLSYKKAAEGIDRLGGALFVPTRYIFDNRNENY